MANLDKRASFGSTLKQQQVIDSKEFIPAKCWINIGVFLKQKDGTKVFVKLPVGLAVDTMKLPKEPTRNSEYGIRISQELELHADAMRIFNEMEEGTEIYPEDVVVEFRKVKAEETVELDPEEMKQIRWNVK